MQIRARGYLFHIFHVHGLEFIIGFDINVIKIHHDNKGLDPVVLSAVQGLLSVVEYIVLDGMML